MTLREFLGIKPNDWTLRWSHMGVWRITTDFGKEYRKCFYMIEYSFCRQKFRLKTSGYCPKTNTEYKTALRVLSQLNSELILK